MIADAAAGYLAVSAERGEAILEEATGTVIAKIEVAVPTALTAAVV